jgi:hypothetical protein
MLDENYFSRIPVTILTGFLGGRENHFIEANFI